ncbi:MAG: DEAD/DEAH box helicase [Porticoccaceae bacterium]|nr:ATP-dependent RNA helicase [Porticoccaceae bacterium]RPG82574.1 MAG: DEAD/DEAH box helicase [Cellvibrionales bacterium TMED47]
MSSNEFLSLGISAPVLKAVQNLGYEQPSPIQAQSIPILLSGKNLLGTAQTGTGKTAAFALPLLSNIDEKQKTPQILVLTPTRELAIQVAEAFQSYAKHIKGFHVLPIYGGADIGGQLRSLKRGAQVVVGTPGRMLDHLKRKSLNLSQVKSLVLDEADEMLRMGFIDDVEAILSKTPDESQRALFSATMPAAIKRVADKYLGDAQQVRIKNKTQTVERIKQQYITVKAHQKMDALTRVLEVEKFDGMIIFVRTKSSTVDISDRLQARGFSSAALNGDLSQAIRERTISKLKRGQVDVVVATDVAARGLDVERISHVINFDIPYDNESYVHRIGRTGRAGREGNAILFITPKETRLLRSIEKTTKSTIAPLTMPSNAQVSDQRIQQFTEQLSKTLETPRLDKFREMIVKYVEENDLDMADVAAALTYENQKERPLFPKLDNIVAPRQDNSRRDRGRGRDNDNKNRESKRRDRKDRDNFSKDSNSRASRPKSERVIRDEDGNEVPMLTYRLEVGKNDSVEPSNIVGAIANEADISSQYIGQIILHDEYSTVDLPDGMPDDVFKTLKKARIRSKALNISIENADGNSALSSRSPRPKKGPKKSKPSSKEGSSKRRSTRTDGSAPLKKKKKTYTKKDKKK